mmetsp:Transcript_33839/g.80385  ORF Transcript_33839/g.80385 Transcript_33839/m.80385 type:complete len:80 (+) Transcript_33839:260-499(+)
METKDKKVARLPKRPSQCDPGPGACPTCSGQMNTLGAMPELGAARRGAGPCLRPKIMDNGTFIFLLHPGLSFDHRASAP